ncbi:MAG: hypothetical protein KF878_14810 [Planctomycetes bacterium]|nr:hypothetical protein [Planctomycetota bacterium]
MVVAAPLRRTAVAVAAAWLLMAFALCRVCAPFEVMYKDVGMPPTVAGEWVLVGVHALRAGWGVVPLGGLVAFLLLPVVLTGDDEGVRRWLRLAIVQAAVVGLCAAFAATFLTLLSNPLGWQCLCPPGCPHRVDGRLLASLPILVMATVQLLIWFQVARTALRQPRSAAWFEAACVAFLTVPPAALLAALAGGVVLALDPPPPAGLLVGAPAAAAGTAALLALGGAIALRARSSAAGRHATA